MPTAAATGPPCSATFSHLRGLLLNREEAVDNAQSAKVGECGRGLGFGDRVHRRADERDVKRERRRDLCCEIDIASAVDS
jgi:hypothetical protein